MVGFPLSIRMTIRGLRQSSCGSKDKGFVLPRIFKALTKVVSNFNAASAGFNFEAFLAVLLDGKQVPANTGTIGLYYRRRNSNQS